MRLIQPRAVTKRELAASVAVRRAFDSGTAVPTGRLGVDWCVCLLMLTALTFSNFSPTLAAAVFVAAAIVLALLKPIKALRSAFDGVLPWCYVLLALISVLWSQQPEATARGVIEFAVTTGAALIVARTLGSAEFLSALMSALLIVDAVSLAIGRTVWQAGGLAMIGIFGSKNAFSEAQGVLFLVSLWVLSSRRQNAIMRSLALLSVFACPVLLFAGRSADAMFAAFVAAGVSLLARSLRFLPYIWRVITTIMAGAIAVCSLLIVYPFLQAIQNQALSLTEKDPTLSGRTYLWLRAGELISQNPLKGTGFEAFWVHGNPYAEDLWTVFGISGRTGYHFHNLWYEAGVELGYPGMILAAVIVAWISIEVIRWFLRSARPESCFFLAYVLFIDMRSVLEVELFSQFSYTWVAFVAAWVYARDDRRSNLMQKRPLPRAVDSIQATAILDARMTGLSD